MIDSTKIASQMAYYTQYTIYYMQYVLDYIVPEVPFRIDVRISNYRHHGRSSPLEQRSLKFQLWIVFALMHLEYQAI